MYHRFRPIAIALAMLAALGGCGSVCAQRLWPTIYPEQKSIQIRHPSELRRAPRPDIPRPPTLSNPQSELPAHNLSLNEAINIGLANAEVVRVLSGVTARSSGSTVYDVAVTNTQIDQEQAKFDPTAKVENSWNRTEGLSADFDPLDPDRVFILGNRGDNHNLDFGLSKTTATGGNLEFGVLSTLNRSRPSEFPLNPYGRSSVDLGFTQPLLQGGGIAVNLVPIVIARIDTEKSFFQYKSNVQGLVYGVIEAYWALVSARTDVWARQRQVAQAEFANLRTEKRLEFGDASAGDVAQTRLALENFRASLLEAQANVLQREAALRNILGLPPYEPRQLVPVTPMSNEQLKIDWDRIVDLAEQQRPDIIELKLILEADEQRLLQSRNAASPKLDAVALYRWNGLEGVMPSGDRVSSRPGQFTDWTLGVNFSVPLGLRQGRAQLRQQELIISRDLANLEQGMHQAVHLLALNLRNLDQYYQQYKRYQAVRAAAQINLDQQMAQYNEGFVQFIIVLQAIVDWGNSVVSEAQALARYNLELASLEQQTGTILETHGIAFYEERFGSLGPLGRLGHGQCYPVAMPPTESVNQYSEGERPSEESFDLRDPLEDLRRRRSQLERLPEPLPALRP